MPLPHHQTPLRVVTWLLPLALLSAASQVQAAQVQTAIDANTLTTCAACHGDHGQGNATAGFPALAGLGQRYLTWQLRDFASGRRVNPVMQPITRNLSAQQINAVARHYAELPPPANPLAASGKLPNSRGARIARRGLWAKKVPACNQCHGRHGSGVGDVFPRLAGQPAAYLAAQLHAWQEDQRTPGPLGLMQAVASRLNDADIKAVSAWFATGTPPPASASSSPATNAPAHPAQTLRSATATFVPPPLSAIPHGQFGDMVRRGYHIFMDTPANASRYTGNQLSCVNCHLGAGRVANAAPLWAAFGAYPAYRKKNHRVNSYADRLRGCFRFSMNGTLPPANSDVILALESYSFWMAKDAPVGESLSGRGYPRLAAPQQPPNYTRGKAVYANHCALCHQADGHGLRVDGHTQFPPLWGPESFNWGAGMGNVDTAAAFIHANMPLGLGGSLTEQQAWDVALYMDSHERPQDPRFTHSVAETRKRFHDTRWSMYGRKVNKRLLGRKTSAVQAPNAPDH